MANPLIPGFEHPDRIPLDEQGSIAADVNCLVCGYNLRTQPIQGRCPECGTAVGRSAHGDLLRYCEPAWVETLSSGMNWLVAGIIANVLLMIFVRLVTGGNAARRPLGDALARIMECTVSLISLVGYWRLTTPDPGRPHEGGSISLRFIARWSQVGSTMFVLASATLGPAKGETSSPFLALSLAGGIVGLIAIAASFTYMRQLALRVPDPSLARSTQIVMWGLLVSMGLLLLMILIFLSTVARQGGLHGSATTILPVACIGAVGLAVFAIWSLVLVLRYRGAFNRAAQDARATWAASAAVE